MYTYNMCIKVWNLGICINIDLRFLVSKLAISLTYWPNTDILCSKPYCQYNLIWPSSHRCCRYDESKQQILLTLISKTYGRYQYEVSKPWPLSDWKYCAYRYEGILQTSYWYQHHLYIIIIQAFSINTGSAMEQVPRKI